MQLLHGCHMSGAQFLGNPVDLKNNGKSQNDDSWARIMMLLKSWFTLDLLDHWSRSERSKNKFLKLGVFAC